MTWLLLSWQPHTLIEKHDSLLLTSILNNLVALGFERIDPFVNAGRRFLGPRLPTPVIDAGDFEQLVEQIRNAQKGTQYYVPLGS